MSDVFISYARSSEDQARRIADALRALGYAVWRDDEIPAHRDYADVIEERLRGAKAVVVIWSAEAVKSQWVRAEADIARESGTLVQLTLDGAALPMPFNRIQCAELLGWNGAAEHPGWAKVAASLADLIGGSAPAPALSPPASPAPPLPVKPSIAVLPFADLSQARDQDYFCDGMVVEIVTALSRFQSLFVIASGSGLSYRNAGRRPDIARELGVRYLLEGSVRKAGDHVRIAVQLVDASEAAQIWSERFDGTLEDVFALQDEVANAVAGRIEPSIRAAEIRRAALRPTQDLGAYDLLLRGLHNYHQFTREGFDRGVELLEEAARRDPQYALAMAAAAGVRFNRIVLGWSPDVAEDRRVSLELRAEALRLAGDDPEVLAYAGMSAHMGDKTVGEAMALRAVAGNPGSSMAWQAAGWIHLSNGKAAAAVDDFQTFLRLDPRSSMTSMAIDGLGIALLLARRFDEAVPVLRQAADLMPSLASNFTPMIVAAHAHAGRLQEARAALEEMAPNTLEAFLTMLEPQDRELIRSGVALARGDP